MMMANYEIWVGGYRCTGASERARFLGTASGESFVDACDNFMKLYDPDNKYYDKERNTHWARRLFDNEQNARKSFG
jgi:hypothetical protein